MGWVPVVIRDFSYATSRRGDPSFAPLTFAFDFAFRLAERAYYCLHIHSYVAVRQGHNGITGRHRPNAYGV